MRVSRRGGWIARIFLEVMQGEILAMVYRLLYQLRRVTGSRISLNLCRSYFKIRCGNYHFVEYNLNTETAAGLLCSVAVSGA